ncbi:hypothetical protein [Amycolatopsis jiangsuensis]|uniref:Asp23/Gls24 family envelope stress response protein n=1 Tax=Amycolatopsis jiangsuensis TaxID=1181879 RepID=A0A840IT43_9PSEU|nr:hypothetical protein [Amycolatopsis jiangsuensis]MBB4684709.1 hypothetical protein [Amycolatopsis jiangsuensis]
MTDPEHDPRWAAVRAAGRRRVPTPPGLVERVLSSIENARSAEPLRLPFDGGSLSLSESAFLLLARTVADAEAAAMPGLWVSAVALAEGRLQVLATVRYGVAATEAADALRERITAELDRQLGARPPVADVHVVDVHPG